MSNNNRAATPYYIFLLCTPTWPPYLLSFEPLGIECKPRIVVIYIINIIVIVRFSPVLLGLLCNCHVSATSRSLETQDFLNMRAVPRMGDNCAFQRCQECPTLHARIWHSLRLSQVYQSLLVLLSLWMFCGFS